MKKVLIIILTLISLNLNYSCVDDEVITQELQTSSDPVKTVSIQQIESFNINTAHSSQSARTASLEEIKIFYENFIDSNQAMAIELLTFESDYIVRKVYFEYKGEVKGYKVTLLFDELNADYSGNLFIEDLITSNLSLFELEKGVIVAAYDVKKVANSQNGSNRSAGTYSEEYYGGEIGEVIVYPKEKQDGCVFCGAGSSTVSNNVFIPGSLSSLSWNLMGAGSHSSSSTNSLSESNKIIIDKSEDAFKSTNNSTNDDGNLSCRSFFFKKITSSSNWQEAGVKGLRFNFDLAPEAPVPVVSYEFRTMYFGLPYQLVNGHVITPGEVAELAAEAANYAGNVLVKKYYGKRAVVSQAVIENEFRVLASAFLTSQVNASASVTYVSSGKNTVVRNAMWNSAFRRLFGNIAGCN